MIRKFEAEKDLLIFADKEQLQRVFVNLLKNAVQAIDRMEDGRIIVSTSQINDSVLVEIEDNGRGIPPELQDKLFSPNFTTKSAGMGLGLAISKGIIETIDGKIWFETKHHEGTKFFVELPLYRSYDSNN